MNELTAEWANKAEDDYHLAGLALSAGEVPVPDGVCFHSQQCAEKYLKAYLTDNLVPFPRGHALILLLELCLPFDVNFESLRSDLESLESYAVAVRYPGFTADDDMAKAALTTATRVRAFLRVKLNLA